MAFAKKLRGLATEPDNSLPVEADGDLMLNEHNFIHLEEGTMEGEAELGGLENENVNEYEWTMDENGEEILIDGTA